MFSCCCLFLFCPQMGVAVAALPMWSLFLSGTCLQSPRWSMTTETTLRNTPPLNSSRKALKKRPRSAFKSASAFTQRYISTIQYLQLYILLYSTFLCNGKARVSIFDEPDNIFTLKPHRRRPSGGKTLGSARLATESRRWLKGWGYGQSQMC